MIKKTAFSSCLVAFFLFAQHAEAQKKISPGFIVTNSNDTIKGDMIDRDWNLSPLSIQFKPADDLVFKDFFPCDILAFGVDHKDFYISRTLPVDISPIRPDELDYSKIAHIVTKQIFLKVLVNGKINLYLNLDEKEKIHFFIQKDTTEVYELILRKYLTESRGQVITIEKFRNQLALYMNDCAPMYENIKRVSFNENALTDLVNKYNSCIDPNYESQVPQEKNEPVRFGILCGYFSSRLTFKAPDFVIAHYIAYVDFPPFNSFTFGMNYIVPILHHFGRHQIVNDLIWKRIDWRRSYIANFSAQGLPGSYQYDYRINYSYLKLNTYYRYSFLKTEQTEYFLELGMSNSIAVHSESTYTRTEVFGNHTYSTRGDIFSNPRKFEWWGLTTGAGIYYKKKFGLKFCFERSPGMSNLINLKSNIESYYVLVNYLF